MKVIFPSRLLLIIVFTIQIHYSWGACSKGNWTVLQGAKYVCVPQTVITASIRPTPQDFLFTLVFEGGVVPFTNISDFSSNINISLSSSLENFQVASQPFLAKNLTADLTIIQIYLELSEIPYGTEMTLNFTDFTSNEKRPSYIKEPIKLAVRHTMQLDSFGSQMLDIFINMDYYLEIIWILASLFSPYWIMYMDCKLYRETFNMFKILGVQSVPFLATFFKMNNYKTAGIRVPNVFGIYILGNDFGSSWEKYSKNPISFDYVNQNRIEDLRIKVGNRLHEFDGFPLFLDNYGVQLTVLLVCLLITLLSGIMIKLLKLEQDTSSWTKFIYKANHIARNFLLMTILGSCQSLIFYSGVQIYAFFSEKTTHNLISFCVTLVTCLAPLICLIAYVILHSKKVAEEYYRETIMNSSFKADLTLPTKPLRFFNNIFDYYKQDKELYVKFILLPIPRALIFSVLTLALQFSPIAQTVSMLVLTVSVTILIIYIRPMSKKLYFIFKIACELVLFFSLMILVILAIQDNAGNFDMDGRQSLAILLVSIWTLIPVLTISLAMAGLFQRFREAQAKKRATLKVVPERVKNSEQVPVHEEEATEIISQKETSKVGIKQLEYEKDEESRHTPNLYSPTPGSHGALKDSSFSRIASLQKKNSINTCRSNHNEDIESQLLGDNSPRVIAAESLTKRNDISEILDGVTGEEAVLISQVLSNPKLCSILQKRVSLQRTLSIEYQNEAESIESEQSPKIQERNSFEMKRSNSMRSKTIFGRAPDLQKHSSFYTPRRNNTIVPSSQVPFENFQFDSSPQNEKSFNRLDMTTPIALKEPSSFFKAKMRE